MKPRLLFQGDSITDCDRKRENDPPEGHDLMAACWLKHAGI